MNGLQVSYRDLLTLALSTLEHQPTIQLWLQEETEEDRERDGLSEVQIWMAIQQILQKHK